MRKTVIGIGVIACSGLGWKVIESKAISHDRESQNNSLLIYQMKNWDKDIDHFKTELDKQHEWGHQPTWKRAFSSPPPVVMSISFREEYERRQRD